MKRPGFVVAGMGMIGIIVIAAIVSIALQWSTVLEEAMIDLTTSMPVFDYEVIDGEEVGNASLDKFLQLRSAAFGKCQCRMGPRHRHDRRASPQGI